MAQIAHDCRLRQPPKLRPHPVVATLCCPSRCEQKGTCRHDVALISSLFLLRIQSRERARSSDAINEGLKAKVARGGIREAIAVVDAIGRLKKDEARLGNEVTSYLPIGIVGVNHRLIKPEHKVPSARIPRRRVGGNVRELRVSMGRGRAEEETSKIRSSS